MDERMHTTPYFHATNLPNVNPKNLVQIGIGGWQVPRAAVPNMVERETNIYTMDDIEVSLFLLLSFRSYLVF
jgi:agmatinase